MPNAALFLPFAGLQSDTYQEDIYPMTAGTEPALSASEWLSGINRGERSARADCWLCFTSMNVQPGPAFWQRKCCNATQPRVSSWLSALWSAFARCHRAYGLAPTAAPALKTPRVSAFAFVLTDPVLMSLKDTYRRPNQLVFKAPVKEKKSVVVNGIDLLENVPPRTENEVERGAGKWELQ